jgi:hypothetical protein
MLPAGDSWVEWTLRLVGTGIDGLLNDTLEDASRRHYPGFRSVNDDQALSATA